MSSEFRAPAQIPANKLYINIGDCRSTIYDANFSTIQPGSNTWVSTQLTLLTTAGSAIFRDMGKTVYIPAGSTSATVSSVLRKVQLVVPGGTGYDAASANYNEGYIQIGGLTYGGGNGSATKVARLN